MAVTSRIREIQSFCDVTIEEWKQAGLIKEFAIKPIIITIEKDLILAKLRTTAKTGYPGITQ